ncbi:MAG: iron ABC transporter permease [Gammaproteobacteria bacterium]|nr:MAG: iron ABC transporter permease [Gammaproteobacteria bacterium]
MAQRRDLAGRRRPVGLLAALAGLWLVAGALALGLGSHDLGLAEWREAFARPDSLPGRILFDLRLPRALAGAVTGGGLAFAGALLQVLLRNPLADPYILGSSGGAALGRLAALGLGLGGPAVALGGLAGALGSILLVLLLARGPGDPLRLLLTGVVLSAGWGAGIAFLLAMAPDASVRSLLFWLMGDLSLTEGPSPGALALLPGCLMAGALVARPADLLLRGPHLAHALGVAVRPLAWSLVALAALPIAVAVSLAGSLGFVGLITPHLLRLAGLREHRWLLPGCLLAGGALVMLADTAARTLFAPRELPVGAFMALLGVPLMLWLLRRRDRS